MRSIFFFMILGLIYSSGHAQVSINTDGTTPDAAAMLDVKSTTKGVLFPRMTKAQRTSISSPPDGLIVFCTDCGSGGGNELTIYSSGNWYSLMKQAQWNCGMPITVTHSPGTVAPVEKLAIYGTVTGIAGEPTKCWITRNLGASQQATAVNDATEASSGWYWQFNRKQGYKNDGTTVTPAWTLNTATAINETSDWLSANDPCRIELGTTWRIPTYTEWNNVSSSGGWTNWNGPWNSALKLHAGGYLVYSAGSVDARGTWGYFWSSTQYNATMGWCFYLSSGFINYYYNAKTMGFNVRCLR